MKINVRVTPNARVPTVAKASEGSYNVKVNAPAREGKANERLIEMLAEHFNAPKSRVRILKGHNSRNKVIEILV
jgi:uncharacterized protein (TIGR00251 family)